MSKTLISRWLNQVFQSRPSHRSTRRPQRTFRPMLEQFEDRVVPATSLMVTSTADSGTGSLRAALAYPATNLIIDFAADVRTIDLTSTGLTISSNVTFLNDQAPGPVTIDGGGKFTVFTIDSGVTVSMTGLTIADGYSTGSGAGIDNSGTLTLKQCTVSGNTAADGGGIYNDAGCKLMVSASTFIGNDSGGGGGGILNDGKLSVTDSTFYGNSADSSAAASPTPPARRSRPSTIPSPKIMEETLAAGYSPVPPPRFSTATFSSATPMRRAATCMSPTCRRIPASTWWAVSTTRGA